MRKRMKIAVFMAGCLALLLTGVSFAFWSGNIEMTNILKADQMTAKIEETFTQGTAPSGTVPKTVTFQNDSSCAAFLRVSYAETWEQTDGDSKRLLNNQVDQHDVAVKDWKNGFGQDSALWTDEQDGWFYYKKILKPGASTEEVLASVTFPEYTGAYAQYGTADYQLYFRMELLQVSDSQFTLNSSDVNQKASSTVFGKQATVTGDNVSWEVTQ